MVFVNFFSYRQAGSASRKCVLTIIVLHRAGSPRQRGAAGTSGLTTVAVLRLIMSSDLVGRLHSPGSGGRLTAPPDRLASNRSA